MMTQAIFWTVEEVAQRAKQFYENGIRQKVESRENIGKMIVIDAESGEYGTDKNGVETALKFKQKNLMPDCLRYELGMMWRLALVGLVRGL
ncbi:hypothetical protein [Laspinema olomoucense]|uniref:hypothetical protein n=1 Tax=Laspinema olomoucense TaxID=3231600 RepID=UPI00294FFD26|nr:hypothetical protein [Laspinema sp. D3b]